MKCTSPSSGALVPTETKARLFGWGFFFPFFGHTGNRHPVQPKKKKKTQPKSLAFVSMGTKAPLEGDVHFTGQSTEQEVEEKKNL